MSSASSHRMVVAPQYFDRSGVPDNPFSSGPRPQRVKRCVVSEWKFECDSNTLGSFTEDTLRVAYTLESQCPFLELRVGEHFRIQLGASENNFTVLWPETQRFNEEWYHVHGDNIPTPPGHQVSVSVLVQMKNVNQEYTNSPWMGSWSLHSEYEQWVATRLLGAHNIVVWQLDWHSALTDMMRHFEGLLQLRCDVPSDLSPTDYWHYARTIKGFSDRPGFHLAALDGKDGQPLTPPWWLTEKTTDFVDESGKKATRALKWKSLPSKDSFHNIMSWEIELGVGLRHEKRVQMEDAAAMFNPKITHDGLFKAIIHFGKGRNDMAVIHVNLSSEGGRRIPPPGTQVEVTISTGRKQDPSQFKKETWNGSVHTQSSVYDFVILAKIPRGNNMIATSNGSLWRKIQLKGDVNTLAIDRQIKYVGAAARHEDHQGCFNLRQMLLAHGSDIDENQPDNVSIIDLLSEVDQDSREWAEQQVRATVDKFTLDGSQLDAWTAAVRKVVGGILLIQGPPGTGKTRINACISVSLAMIGLKSTLAAGSNLGADALALSIIKMIQQYPEFGAEFELLRYNTPYTTKQTLEEQEPLQSDDPSEVKRTGLQRALLSVPSMLSEAGVQDEEDRQLSPYKTANQLNNYARANPADPVCNLWLNSLRKVSGHQAVKLQARKVYDDWEDNNERLTRQYLRSRKVRILVTTLNNCASDQLRDSWKAVMLLVDEAGQALEPDFAIAATMEGLKVVVLTGDDKQLPPTVLSLNTGQNEYAPQLVTSIFERLKTRGYPFRMLLTNYRMHPEISWHPNEETYDGRLMDGPNTFRPNDAVGRTWDEFTADPASLFGILQRHAGQRCLLVNVNGEGQKFPGSNSLHNAANVNAVQQIVEEILKFQSSFGRPIEPRELTVITPYKDQKLAIIQDLALKDRDQDLGTGAMGYRNVKVSTVDGFQGHENEIVIVDLTQSNPTHPERVGFLADPRRLNVAITRAKQVLILIGNMSLWWPVVEEIEDKRVAPSFAHLLRHINPQAVVSWPADQTNSVLRPRPIVGITNAQPGPSGLVPPPLPHQNAGRFGHLAENPTDAEQSVRSGKRKALNPPQDQ